MFKNEYMLSVDIKKSMSTIIPVFVQYDSAALVFKIYDDGKSFDLTDFTSAEVSHKLPDGTFLIGYGALETLSNGQKAVRYTYQGNEMSQPGFVSTSLSVYSTDKKVSILPFKVEIVGDTYEEPIEASPEVGILQQLITSVSGVSGQATQAVASATQAVTQANIAINNAQAIVDSTRSIGAFNRSTAYLKNNIVTSNGSSWIALVNTQNNPLPTLPTVQNTWWRLLAQKGEDGTGGVEIVDEIPPGASGIFFEKQGENPDVPDNPNNSDISSIIEVVNKQLEDRATNIKSSGAKADGSNSKSAIQDAIASSKEILIPSETFTTTDSAWIGSSVTIKGNKGSKITQSSPNAGGDLVINSSDITIDGIEFEGASTSQGIYFSSNIKRFELKNATIKTRAQAIHINNPNTEHVDIVGNDITADSYAVLTNYNALNSKNINILFNNIYSRRSDAIELNNPNPDNTKSWHQAKIIGNTITADYEGTGTTAGFAIGIANTRDVVILGNIIEKSRNEAFHVEDGVENIVATGNVFNGCLLDGAMVQARGSNNSIKGKPVILSNNHFKKYNLMKTGSGIWRVNNSFGVSDLILTGNYIRGFNNGMFLDGHAYANVDGSYIEECNVGLALGAHSITSGTVTMRDVPTLVRGSSGSIMDRVVSTTPAQTILQYSGTAGRIGATLKGFTGIAATKTSATGTSKFPLFKIPTRMQGKLKVHSREDNVNFYRVSCDIKWDGTTLTVDNVVTHQNGGIGGGAFEVTDGLVTLSLFTASPWDFTFIYDFDGEYYQA